MAVFSAGIKPRTSAVLRLRVFAFARNLVPLPNTGV